MRALPAILNLPWSLLGLVIALVSLPRSVGYQRRALIFRVRSWWWTAPFWWLKGIRGFASGNIVALGPNKEPRDLEHELIHVEQYERYPFIFPLLSAIEAMRHGFGGSRFEREAYNRAGNVYRGKKTYDAIIVLGGGVDEQGNIPDWVVSRVKESVRLLKEGVAPRVIMSGKWGYMAKYTPPRTEAAAMKAVAIASGAAPDAILLEESSLDTLGNAYFCKKLFLEPSGWHHVLVLATDHHAPRAEYLFRKVLGPAYRMTMLPVAVPMPPEERAAKDARHQRSLDLAKQWLDPVADGDDAAIWAIMSTKHPAYAERPEVSKEELERRLDVQ